MRHVRVRKWVLIFVLVLVLGALCALPGSVGAAGGLSQSFKPTVMKELTDLRTENSKTYLLSDGAHQAVIYSSPIQFKDEKGDWKEIDTSLVPSPDGGYSSAATPVKVKLTSKDKGGPLVSLDYKGAKVELYFEGKDFAAPTVKGSTASYAESAPVEVSATTETTPPPSESTTTESSAPVEETTTTSSAASAQGEAALATTETTPNETPETTESTPTSDTLLGTVTSDTAVQSETTDSTAPPLEETTTTEPALSSEISLSYEVLASGVKETITLASPSAPNTFTFTLRHPGVILREDHAGQWGFYDIYENPEPLLVLSPLVVLDSSKDASGEPAQCPEATMMVSPGKSESEVTITVPRAWLSDPARVFPITIDPTVTQQVAYDNSIHSGYPTYSYYSTSYSSVGYEGPPHNWITALFKFNLPSDLNNGAWVQSAHFQVYQWQQSSSSPQMARASAMTIAWSNSSTYNSLGATPWFGSDTRACQTSGAQAEWLDFDFTSTVQAWADGTKPNYGFTLYQNQTDQSRNWWRRVYHSERTDPPNVKPKLTITYVLPTNVVTSYGANGADILNDTAAFQNAINAVKTVGGTVYVPAGTYYLDGSLTVSGGNVTLMGVGTESLLRPFSEASDSLGAQDQLVKVGDSSASSNLTIKDLSLQMPRAGHGIKITGSGTMTGLNIVGNIFSGGADSATTSAVEVDAVAFSDLNITDNDMSFVTNVPFAFDSQTGSRSILRNVPPAKPYSADLIVGSDAYDAAVRLSKSEYPSGAQTVVLMTGESYALSASAAVLAKAYSAPVLLSHTASLDSVTQAELKRLGPSKIFVVGLSSTIATAASDCLTSVTIDDDTGANDNATAANIATDVKTRLGSVSKVVVVASDYPIPGLAVAPGAAKQGWPVLLTPRNGPLPSETSSWYTANMATPSAVEVGTTVTLTGISNPTVINGADDYATADLVVGYEKDSWGCTYGYTGLASGASSDWQYSLASGAYLGKHSGIMLVTNAQTIGVAESSRLAGSPSDLEKLVYLNLYTPWQDEQAVSPWLPQAPHHTSYDLAGFADHSATVYLDTRSLVVETADLDIDSFGSDAALSRTYSSARTDATYTAPGWRFGFERKLTFPVVGQQTNYTDEYGDVYTFLSYGSTSWTPPSGYSGILDQAGSNWILIAPGGDTLTFDSAGKLLSEADSNGNTTSYTWTSGYVSKITAANGQEIQLTLNGSHQITQASYTSTNGTRTVAYATAAPWTVTYSYVGSPSTPARSLTYGYTSARLTGITATAFTSGADSTETFAYSGSDLAGVTYPDISTNADAYLGISYGTRTATVTSHGTVYAYPDAISGVSDTDVTQTFTWNQAGTIATRTNPKSGTDPTQTWSYSYSPHTNYLLSETSPLGETKSWTYNNHGNVATETDELNHTTLHAYPNSDPLIPHTIQVAVSGDLDDAHDASGNLRITGYDYVAVGRGTYVDKGGWVFRNITIPQGSRATITGAHVKFYAEGIAGTVNNLVSELGLAKVTQLSSWSAGQNPATLPITTSKISNWRPTWTIGTWVTSPDLSAAVEEVTDQAGWVSGNNLGVLWRDSGTAASNVVDVGSFSYGYPAVLTIDYLESHDPNRDHRYQSVQPAGGGSSETNYDYDPSGNQIEVSNTMSHSQASEISTEYALVPDESTYAGAITSEETQIDDGTSAVSTYDSDIYYPNGKPKKTVYSNVVLASGQTGVTLTVTETYDNFGNLLTKTDTSGQVTETNSYDLAGRLLTSTGPTFTATIGGTPYSTQIVTRHIYDAWGHETESYQTSSGEAAQTKADWTTNAYDKAGRVSEIKRWLFTSPPPSGTPQSTQTLTHDGLGRLIETADTTVSGLPARTSYDARGNEVVSWTGGACTGSYDPNKATRHLNADSTSGYDAVGNMLRSAEPGNGPTIYTYTDDNKVLRETKPDDTWTENTYDAAGNVAATTSSVSSPSVLTTAAYDLAGNLTSSTDGNHLTTGYTYDDAGRQVSAGVQGYAAETTSGTGALYCPAGSAPNPTSTMSLAFWLKSPNDRTQSSTICRKWVSTPVGWSVDFVDAPGEAGRIRLHLDTSGGQQFGLQTTTNVLDNTWHHIVFVVTAGTNSSKVYVDGVLDNSATYQIGTGFGCTANLELVKATTGQAGLGVDEFALWDRVLSAEEIGTQYGVGRQPTAPPSHREVMLGLAPLAYWPLDEASGNAIDVVGGRTATWNSSIARSKGTPLPYGQAPCTGTGAGYVYCAAAGAPNPNTSLTLSLWLKSPNDRTQWATICRKWFNYLGWSIDFQDPPGGSGRVRLHLDTSVGCQGGSLMTTQNVLDNQWHHIVFVVTAGTNASKVYVDGTLNTSVTYQLGTGFACTDNLNLLQGSAGQAGLCLDEFAVFDKVLSASEIFALCQARYGSGSYPGLVKSQAPLAYWPLDEPSGNATDAVAGLAATWDAAVGHGERSAVAAGGSSYVYNTLSWQLRVDDADGFSTTRIFDSAGKVTSETTGGYTSTTTYQTGGSGLISQKDEADGHRTTLTYDWFGRVNRELQTLTSPSSTYKDTSTTYDTLGRVATSTDNTRNLSHSFTYPQNTAGNTTEASWVGASGSDRVSTALTLGADGLEASRASTITSSPQIPTITRSIDPTTGRDDAKRITKATLQTDLSRYVYSRYAYDTSGHILRQWGKDSGDGSGYLDAARTGDPTYSYDAISGLKTRDNLQLESVGTAGGYRWDYTYTTNGRLSSAALNQGPSESYTFDAAGNILTAGSTTFYYQTGANVLDHSTSGGTSTYYFFDKDKRWRTAQANTNSQTDPNRTIFTYTGTGRLACWTKYTGGSATTTATYNYDTQGQRTKSVVAVTGGLTTTTDFVYEGLLLQGLSASQTGTGATSWKITYLYDEYGRPYAGVYRNPGTSTNPVVFAIVSTDRGDVVELLDAAGAPFAAYRYDAWGNPQGVGTDNDGSGLWYQTTGLITSSTVARDIARRQVLRYAGYCWDAESALYYLSARSYDPRTRQFLSEDPAKNDGETSAYQYCRADPVQNIDPTGLRTSTWSKVIFQNKNAQIYHWEDKYKGFWAQYKYVFVVKGPVGWPTLFTYTVKVNWVLNKKGVITRWWHTSTNTGHWYAWDYDHGVSGSFAGGTGYTWYSTSNTGVFTCFPWLSASRRGTSVTGDLYCRLWWITSPRCGKISGTATVEMRYGSGINVTRNR